MAGTTRGKTALDAALALGPRAHVDKYENGSLLTDLIASTEREVLVVTLGAESSNVIAVTLTLNEGDGTTAKGRAATVQCKLYDAAMLDSLVGEFTLSDTATGVVVSTDARPCVQLTLAAGGTAVLDCTDVAEASGLTIYAVCTVYGSICAPTITAIEFD